ncbi:tetratricopeptide repeat protein [Clostridium formicaceticum]|uniref:Beta-barrel assembly-enhancing protease n=1 Tax=Clostridium formicaceticum TaxID=1497 RepID=A0AAC9RNG7_9CLOT|nr:tetratricopeptide repeat protein [Clostridium formicaceticum]AOY78154.1 hypothetical protein BJL90_21185 [Clostridium formicaceticum]ARE88807.1 Beta-barrel assembly-enhancing protease [Clostridium formicaceticum]
MSFVEALERKLDQLMKEPDHPQTFNHIGVLLYQMKDLQAAAMYFQRAYQLNPLNEDVLYNYASLLYQQGEFQQAIPIYKAYLALNENDIEMIQKLGDCYYHLGEYESAGKMYEALQKYREENL